MASLFGATPQEILYNQFKEEEKMRLLKNQQIAQEGGQFGVFAPLYQAGRKFGEMGSQAVTGALFPEMVNPQLAKAQKLQSILGKYQQEGTNLSDPATLTKMGGELITSGLGEEGIKAITLAKSLTPESPYAKIDPSKYTPESLKTFAVTKNQSDLVPIEGVVKPSFDFLAKGKELGFGTSFKEYTPEQVKQINKALFNEDVEKKKAGAMNVDVGSALNAAAARQTGKEKAEAWAKTGDIYKNSITLTSKIDEFKSLVPKAFIGTGAQQKAALSSLLSAAGVPVSEKLSNTQLLEAFKSQFVQGIAKNFPGSQALKELEQLILSQPNILQQPQTINRLLDRMKDEQVANQRTYEQLAKLPEVDRYNADPNIVFAQNFRNIQKYRVYEARANNPNDRLSADEIAEAKKLKQELGL